MGEDWEGGGNPFWRAGEEPVRPVRTFRKTDKDEQGNKEVRKEAVKEKKSADEKKINMPTGERRDYTQEEREKGKKAAAKEKYKAYQRAVESEKEMEKDSEHRERERQYRGAKQQQWNQGIGGNSWRLRR